MDRATIPVRPELRWTQVGAARVAYRVAGDGAPVVLLHGLAGSGRWWARNVDALAARFRVFLLDLAGFGESRGGPPVPLPGAADLVVDWMGRAGLERASFVGHSMGGRVASDLAAAMPDRVERLVLVAPAIFPTAAAPRPWETGAGMVRTLRHTSPALLPRLALDAGRAGPRILWRATREVLTPGSENHLSRIAAPTLLVWGAHDGVVPLAVGHRLAALLPDAELVILPSAGHSPMWDRPDEFNRLVTDFLAEPPVEGTTR
jgi:pimeloyl-ACP methyl ester carboxylesterase